MAERLDGLYNIIDEVLVENRVPKEFRDLIVRSIIGRCSRAGYIKMEWGWWLKNYVMIVNIIEIVMSIVIIVDMVA